MDLLDLVIILTAIGYAYGGYRNGAVVGVFSLAGFLGGAIAGAQLGHPLATSIAHGEGQVIVALVCVLVLALVGQLALVWVARRLRDRITWKGAQAADSGVGSVLGVVSVLLVAWMVAVPLARSPYPSLVTQVDRSAIVTKIDAAMPDELRKVYSSLQSIIDQSGFPQVFGNFQSTRIVTVGPPDTTIRDAPGVINDRASVLKVYGTASRCHKSIEGSGFVYAPGRMLTNAHVVAGTNRVAVQVSDTQALTARVVLYDPERDVAVLDVPGLKAPPLDFAKAPAKSDDSAVVLGFPLDGPFTIGPSRIRDQETIKGPDIYGRGTIIRSIYSIRGTVQSGNSGGPLITPDGQVLGIVFARALDTTDTGFVLTNAEIQSDADAGRSATEEVSAGTCTD